MTERVFAIKQNVVQSHAEWAELNDERRLQYQLLLGHGVHKFRGQFASDAFRLTVIREPVDRVISLYYFAKASPRHYLHRHIVDNEMTLAQFAVSGLSPEIVNNYARRFSGILEELSRDAPEECARQTVELMMAEYSVIGFTDSLDNAMNVVAEKCGFAFKWIPERRNITGSRPQEIDEAARKLIEEMNAADVLIFKTLKQHSGREGCVLTGRQ